jgi:NADH dehydrogenase
LSEPDSAGSKPHADQRNHHLFQPLLYQVATAALATSEIAWPIRHLLHRHKNVMTLLGNVIGVNSGHAVSRCGDDGVELDGAFLPAKTIIWAAGVAASPAADWLKVPADRAGRVLVNPDLTVPGHADIFVIGDAAHVETDGKPVPGVAPAAKQEGRYVADVIKGRLQGKHTAQPFVYKSAGNLATIEKRAAIVDFGWIKLTGRPAWWIWSFVHIFFLIGLRNRLAVAMNWLWIYISGQRSARLITQGSAKAKRDQLTSP